MHQAKAVEPWRASHPRLARRWLPPSCPQANPIARVFGEVPDPWTRHHTRPRFGDGVHDVERHRRQHRPGFYTLSRLYDAPAVTAAVERLAVEQQATRAA